MTNMDYQEPPRIAQNRAEIKRDQLSHYPEIQPDVIARHYLSLAAVAQHLAEMVKAKSYLYAPEAEKSPAAKATDETIALFVRQIKDAHLRDFGIPLEWENEERKDQKSQ